MAFVKPETMGNEINNGTRCALILLLNHLVALKLSKLGPVARSLVSANHWLRGIKMYRFPWYLTLVSTNHATRNPGQGGG